MSETVVTSFNHLSSRAYDCNFCNYSCAKIKELREHLRTHGKIIFKQSQDKNDGLKDFSVALGAENSLNLDGNIDGLDSQQINCDPELNEQMTPHKEEKLTDSAKSHGPQKCKHCPTVFESARVLKVHVRQEHPQRMSHKCDQCNFASEFAFGLKYHVKTRHPVKKGQKKVGATFNCVRCSYKAKFKGSLMAHIKASHPKFDKNQSNQSTLVCKSDVVDEITEAHRCEFCQTEYSTSYELHSHVQKVHKDLKSFACQHCDFIGKSRASLKYHMRANHSSSTESLYVEDEAVTSDNLVEVDATDDRPAETFQCKFCDSAFRTETSLKIHANKMHKIHANKLDKIPDSKIVSQNAELKTKKFNCKICPSGFATKKGLRFHSFKKHQNLLSDAKQEKIMKLQCDKCDFNTKSEIGLKFHKAKKHKNSNSKVNEKKKINGMKNETSKDDAISNKSNPQNQNGDQKKSSDRKDIENENIVCPPKTPEGFQCGQCNYVSKTRSTFRSHFRRVHLGIKDQQCPNCPYIAGNKSDLNKHVRIVHLKIKNFRCRTCDYKSSLLSSIIHHVRGVHLKQKNMICPGCEHKFFYLRDIMKHLKMKHPELPTTSVKRPAKISKKERDTILKEYVQKSKSAKDIMPQHKRAKDPPLRKDSEKTVGNSNKQQAAKKSTKTNTSTSIENPKKKENLGSQIVSAKDSSAKVKTITCPFCKYQSSKLYFIVKHVNKKHDSKINLQHLEKSFHQKPPTYSCPKCTYKTRKIDLVKKHIDKNHPDTAGDIQPLAKEGPVIENGKIFKCSECNFKSLQKSLMTKHLFEKHPDRASSILLGNCQNKTKTKLKCPKCKFATFKKGFLVRHVERKHSLDSESILQKIENRTDDVIKSQDVTASKKKYGCSECEYRTKFKTTISKHLNSHHPGCSSRIVLAKPNAGRNKKNKTPGDTSPNSANNNNPDEKCLNKLMEFEGDFDDVENDDEPEAKLSLDEDSNSSRRPGKSSRLSCSKCEFTARFQPDLIRHYERSHMKRGIDKKCPYCNYRTSLSVLLRSHMIMFHLKNGAKSQANPAPTEWSFFS